MIATAPALPGASQFVTARVTFEVGGSPTFTVRMQADEAQSLIQTALAGPLELGFDGTGIYQAMPPTTSKRNKPVAFGVFKDVAVGIIYTVTQDGKPPRFRWLEKDARGKKHRRGCYTKTEAVQRAKLEAERIWKRNHGAKAAAQSTESAELCALGAEVRAIAKGLGLRPSFFTGDAAEAVEVLTTIYPDKHVRPSLTEAAHELVRKVLEMKEQNRLTFNEVMTDVVERLRKKGKMKNGTQGRRFKSVGDRFAKQHGTRYVADITVRDIETWFREELGETVSVDTAKQYLSALRVIFTFARKVSKALPPDEKLTAAHLAELDPDDHRRSNKIKIEAYTADEKRKILNAADESLEYPEWTHVIAILFDSAVHFQELIRLRFSDITIGPDRSTLTISKEAAVRHGSGVMHFPPATVTWIIDEKEKADAAGEPDRWIVPGVTGGTIEEADQCYGKVYAEFCDARESILADAGVKMKKNGFRRGGITAFMTITWNLQATADFARSEKKNLAPHYVDVVQQAEMAHTKAGVAYYQIGRPGCGDFSRSHPHDWLPEEVFRTQAQARADVNSALAQLKAIYRKTGI